MGKLIFAALVVVLLVPGEIALASIVKKLRVESIPSGAKVYLPQGTRNKLLGTTPFIYQAEFHSKISVHRLLFKKPLYEDQIIKVSAGEEKIRVVLKSVDITARPESHDNASERNLQARVNSVVEKELPHLMQKKTGIPFDLRGPVTMNQGEDGGIVVLRVSLVDWRQDIKGSDEVRRKAFVRTVWDELGPLIIVPLARALNGISGLTGLALDVLYDEKRFVFGVKPSVERHVEMECVPGMRQELRPAFRYEDGREISILELHSVWDPCVKRIPVTRSAVKLDPRVAVQKGLARGLFLLRFPAGDDQAVVYEGLSILLYDTKGAVVFRQGDVSSSLLVD